MNEEIDYLTDENEDDDENEEEDAIYQSIDEAEEGVYLVSRPSESLAYMVDHMAVLDIGNYSDYGHENSPSMPVIIHMTTSDGIISEDFEGVWEVLYKMSNPRLTKKRILEYLEKKGNKFNVFDNNCETFAYYVTTGKAVSPTAETVEQLIREAVRAGINYILND